MTDPVRRAFEEHCAALSAWLPELTTAVERLGDALCTCLRDGGRVLTCGNGGSAADAQHLASELVGCCERRGKALAAIALTTDTAILTAVSNDLGYERVFARQVEALGRRGDLLVGFSTSGQSPNVIQAALQARSQGLLVAALTGALPSPLGQQADLLLAAPASRVPRVQELHGFAIHCLCEYVEARLR